VAAARRPPAGRSELASAMTHGAVGRRLVAVDPMLAGDTAADRRSAWRYARGAVQRPRAGDVMFTLATHTAR
jgi:hypothetical protein